MERHGLAEDSGIDDPRAEEREEEYGGEAREAVAEIRAEREERRGRAGEEERRPVKQILMLGRAEVANDLAPEGDVEVRLVQLRIAVQAGAVEKAGGENLDAGLALRPLPLDLIERQRHEPRHDQHRGEAAQRRGRPAAAAH